MWGESHLGRKIHSDKHTIIYTDTNQLHKHNKLDSCHKGGKINENALKEQD